MAVLREWIRLHKVCWETITHREAAASGILSVGYDVALSARLLGGSLWDPGDTRATEALEGLRRIAEAVIHEDDAEDVSIAPMDGVLQLRAQSDWQPEVRLVIEVCHDHGYFAAIDDEERGCVRRLERALEGLGVRRDAWRAAREGMTAVR